MKKQIPHFKFAFLLPQYWPIWIIIGILRLIVFLPHSGRMCCGRILGDMVYFLSPKLRKITTINIGLCFKEKSEEERRALVRKSYHSLGKGIIETGMAWWLSTEKLKSLYEVSGLDTLDTLQAQKKGVLLFGIHQSSTELGGRIAALNRPLHVMYQPTRNPLLDWLMYRYRSRIYLSLIPSHDVRRLIRLLQDNERVWYAPDQAPSPRRSVYVPFFNVLTASSTTTSQILELSGSPVMVCTYSRRADDKGYVVEGYPLKDFPAGNVEGDALRLNQVSESIIRQYPEQYLWQYKRFKATPPGEVDVYAEV